MNQVTHQHDAAPELIRIKRVLEISGLSRNPLYVLMRKHEFPKPVKLSGGRTAAWVLSEIQAWIRDRIADRDEAVVS